jgi:hypothetical protein
MFKIRALYLRINSKILLEVRDFTGYFEVRSQPSWEATGMDFFVVSIDLPVLNTTDEDWN